MNFRQIFTPGSPPQKHEFLVGRDEEIRRLCSYLSSPGIHPVVVGPRGIGKTSLVQEVLGTHDLTTQIEANTVNDFDELARLICDDLGLTVQHVVSFTEEHEEGMDAKGKIVVAEGGLSSKRKSIEQIDGMSKSMISPQSFLRLLESSNTLFFISIDELDDLDKNSDIPIKLAKFAKSVSNQSKRFRHKFIFSGIGRDAQDLFSGHLSSQRNHPVIYLGRLTKRHFNSFFDRAAAELEMIIPQPIRNEIISDADGFPYYMHLACFHMFDCFFEQNSQNLHHKHLKLAKDRAFDDAFSHYLSKYKYTIYRLTDLHKSILWHMVGSTKRYHEYDNMEAALGKQYGVKGLKQGFRYLLNNEYIYYRKADKRVSLREPLLRPFLRAKLRVKVEEKQMSLWNES